jgi:hypothetical protein
MQWENKQMQWANEGIRWINEWCDEQMNGKDEKKTECERQMM